MSILTAFNEPEEHMFAEKKLDDENLQVCEVPMEVGKGTPLEEFWGDEGKMSEDEILQYFNELADGNDPQSSRVPVPKKIIDENPEKFMNMSKMEWEIFDCKQTYAKNLALEKDAQRRAKLYRQHKKNLKAIKRKYK